MTLLIMELSSQRVTCDETTDRLSVSGAGWWPVRLALLNAAQRAEDTRENFKRELNAHLAVFHCPSGEFPENYQSDGSSSLGRGHQSTGTDRGLDSYRAGLAMRSRQDCQHWVSILIISCWLL